MKKHEPTRLQVKPRTKQSAAIQMPEDVIVSLRDVAGRRDMSVEALVRYYIGQGLRQDLATSFSERILARAGDVLSRHLADEEVSTVLRELEALPSP